MTRLLLIAIILLSFLLRIYRLSANPPSLYWDEASLGYNAFSIAETLHDEHGEFLPIGRFIAFGDYKPSGYIYATVPFVKILGLSEFSIRLPSVIAGTLLVIATFFLVKEFFWKNSRTKLALISALLVGISPWSLQFSRGAFEANLATLASVLGVLFFLKSLKNQHFLIILLSAFFLTLSLYTFNSHRVFVPLLLVALVVIYCRTLLRTWKKFLIFLIFFGLLLLPLLPHLASREGKLRFYEVTWLNDLAPIELSNARIAADGNSLPAKLVHNRRFIFAEEFLKHYFDHFRSDFLFFSGDVNPRLSIQTQGELFWIDLAPLLLGIYFLLKTRKKEGFLILAWFFLAPIPAATARETPHALRILHILPTPQIIVACGLVYFLHLLKTRLPINSNKFLSIPIVLLYVLSFNLYLHDYHLHYPKDYASSWQYGYKEMVDYVSTVEKKYDYVNVTETYGRPYIYFLFYKKYSPTNYVLTRKVERDWYGFWYVHGFAKYSFGDKEGPGKWLLVRGPKGTPGNAKLLKTIHNPNGEVVFEISEKL